MRRATPKRTIKSDPRYNSLTIAKLTNYIMRRGKKSTAENIIYDCLAVIKEKTKKDPLETFDLAFKNISPEVELKSRRIGGANYQIPIAVVGPRKLALALKWLVAGAKARKGMPMKDRLALELIDAANNTGAAVKKRDDTYRMAEANRAFAHFARFSR